MTAPACILCGQPLPDAPLPLPPCSLCARLPRAPGRLECGECAERVRAEEAGFGYGAEHELAACAQGDLLEAGFE